ncbi:DUF1677 domain-containing protein [Cephalotus follicularis]|uniref:DUF1677 domain-containing protein n=1 Tax=Cephalotus follicularis TaxID=3775 RepID=A0A1Q3DB84_CEPFO|nr:DUF1677 domain-containing protein [Cephalotus follicularis]
MTPHGEAIINGGTHTRTETLSRPPRLSNDTIHRTISDNPFELNKQEIQDLKLLPPISEVEDAKCECCDMHEECTPESIDRVRSKFSGKWICGLCAEAVKDEIEKNGGKKDEALSSHMSACSRFNKFNRAYPVLFQAEAMRELLRRSSKRCIRTKSLSPRDKPGQKKAVIARSSSCIPAITKEINDIAS